MSVENNAQWAIDLLTPEASYQENLLSKYYHYIMLPAVSIGGVIYANWMTRRPLFSSFHRYGIALACGIYFADVLKKRQVSRQSERDAILRSYVRMHPEDFPPPERKTFNELFERWVPCR